MSNLSQLKANRLLMDVFKCQEELEQAEKKLNRAKKIAHEYLAEMAGEDLGLRYYDFQIGGRVLRVSRDFALCHPRGEWVSFVEFEVPNDLTHDFNELYGA